jgi:hypothetical protein
VRVFHQQLDELELDTEADLIAISFFSGFAMAAYTLAVHFKKKRETGGGRWSPCYLLPGRSPYLF